MALEEEVADHRFAVAVVVEAHRLEAPRAPVDLEVYHLAEPLAPNRGVDDDVALADSAPFYCHLNYRRHPLGD